MHLAAMTGNTGQRSGYRRLWLPDLIALACVAVLSTVLFRTIPLDVWLEGFLYRQGQGGASGWYLEEVPFWRFFYDYGSWPAALVVIASVLVIMASYKAGREKDRAAPANRFVPYRIYCLFLILVLVVGPGILINSLLKIHTGRPRPLETRHFGGNREYQKVLAKGESGRGKSFPCGHCSMGFYFFAFYFLFKRKKRRLAYAFLLFALVYGLLIGFARMASGGHFPSDVLWSGMVMFFTCLVLYYFVLAIPGREDMPPPALDPSRDPSLLKPFKELSVAGRILLTGLAVVTIGGVLAGLLLSTPVYKDFDYRVSDSPLAPTAFDLSIQCRKCNIALLTDGDMADALEVTGNARGFGLPGSAVDLVAAQESSIPSGSHTRDMAAALIDLAVQDKGVYSDLVTSLAIRVKEGRARRIKILAEEGDITVSTAKEGGAVPFLAVRLIKGTLSVPRHLTSEFLSLDIPQNALKYR